jgi:hypothetical protein
MSQAQGTLDVIWRPNPGPQTYAIQCPAEILLFGGAVGGGKSDWLLGDFCAHAQRHGAHARGILFRRTYPELEELITRAHELYPPMGARYNKQERMWRFPGGATLKMRYIERDKDWTRYQGHSYTWMAFDEAGLYATPYVLTMLRSRLRSPHGVPVRLCLTANPGGPGHGWLKEWFMVDREGQRRPALLPWYDEEQEAWMVFIPSKLTDNPQLMDNDPRYSTRIKGPAWLRLALLQGDWDVLPEGGILDPGLVRRDRPPAAMRIYMGIDPAASPLETADATAIAVWGCARIGAGDDQETHYWLLHADEWRMDTQASVERIIDAMAKYQPTTTWMEGGPVGVGMRPWLLQRMRKRGRIWPTVMASHGTDKIAKAAPLQGAVCAGLVHCAPGAEYWPLARDRMAIFTGEAGGVDDLVDALGMPLRFAPALWGKTQPPPEAEGVPRSSLAMRQEQERQLTSRGTGEKKRRTQALW